MQHPVLNAEVQQFIKDNTGKPVSQLALQKNPFPDVEWAVILNQVAAREKAQGKLPRWFAAENIIYPSKVSVEQTSSEATAKYKARLVSGERLIDLTGGLGVDDLYFAEKCSEVVHCELDPELSTIAAHNFRQLSVGNITCMQGDSLGILKSQNRQWDWIYIDPSRRNGAKGKVFMLADCLPDVPALLDTYFTFSANIMVKTAPLLDISAGLAELSGVKAIHVVALNNEVKELLWLLEKDCKGTPAIHAVNLVKDNETIVSGLYGSDVTVNYSLPQEYLYEPNSAIMKSGLIDAAGHSSGLSKLHRHSQLFTSASVTEFPGRRFKIQQVLLYNKSEMKRYAEGRKMNITVRNFPVSVEELRKKWKIKDGGDVYAFFTTNMNNEKIVMICIKS
ncbi:SAM-dependent methyltransferase [Flavobacterium cyanobacteriorum]|uniref:SAM-dependent methyltransferase n=1 Tax=Flavobacterium cyanobacteriorum TaxID=2022802 RepID=A0A255ZPY1_9FLAO|nr:SAM-dependent methyltransferase [Flavobacterium cyanobacteriorum]OYQ43637.1 SAM-dependent methyltransferase [Flavobacterium cyanobacteriorum]